MKKTIITIVILAIIIVVAVILSKRAAAQPGPYDELATCISDSGAKFYGAFWCPHCLEQKTMFKRSQKLLPYVECSTKNRADQTQICKDEKVESYPTWDFADGERVSGVLTFEMLAEKTNCPIPVQ